MRKNVFSTGLNSDQSYIVNELCHSARHNTEVANRLGFNEKVSAFYAANALKRSRPSDKESALLELQGGCLEVDSNMMREIASITERDLTETWGNDATYALGDFISRFSVVSRTGLKSMIQLPQAELNAIRSRCINWSTPKIAKAVHTIGGTWDIIKPAPELLTMLHTLAEKDRNLEQKIRLLTFLRTTQQNIGMLLGISRTELQVFSEYYLVDVYAPPGRTKHLSMSQRAKLYRSLLDIMNLSKCAKTKLEPIDQFIALCSSAGIEGRCILQDLPHLHEYEACKTTKNDIANFMRGLNIETEQPL